MTILRWRTGGSNLTSNARSTPRACHTAILPQATDRSLARTSSRPSRRTCNPTARRRGSRGSASTTTAAPTAAPRPWCSMCSVSTANRTRRIGPKRRRWSRASGGCRPRRSRSRTRSRRPDRGAVDAPVRAPGCRWAMYPFATRSATAHLDDATASCHGTEDIPDRRGRGNARAGATERGVQADCTG